MVLPGLCKEVHTVHKQGADFGVQVERLWVAEPLLGPGRGL